MSENQNEKYTINQSFIKNVKIVPENIRAVEQNAWFGKFTELVENSESLVNLKKHSQSEKRIIKIYSIKIDDFEENENEKLCAKEIVKSCKITIINENICPNYISKECGNVENQKQLSEKKKKSQKPYIFRIYDCCPWNVPWILLIISIIQVSRSNK